MGRICGFLALMVRPVLHECASAEQQPIDKHAQLGAAGQHWALAPLAEGTMHKRCCCWQPMHVSSARMRTAVCSHL